MPEMMYNFVIHSYGVDNTLQVNLAPTEHNIHCSCLNIEQYFIKTLVANKMKLF